MKKVDGGGGEGAKKDVDGVGGVDDVPVALLLKMKKKDVDGGGDDVPAALLLKMKMNA